MEWRHDIQRNVTKHNGIQHYDNQHKLNSSSMTLSIMTLDIDCCYAECHYAECCNLDIIMLNVVMVNVFIVSVVTLNVVALEILLFSPWLPCLEMLTKKLFSFEVQNIRDFLLFSFSQFVPLFISASNIEVFLLTDCCNSFPLSKQ
jgi:hypothetical protein